MPQGWTECSPDCDTVWRALYLIRYDNTWSSLWYYIFLLLSVHVLSHDYRIRKDG